MLMLLCMTLPVLAAEGDLRFRLQRRFPDCQGTIEGAYGGDEFAFYQRVRFSTGAWRGTLLLDKDRGEEWVDTAAGGIAWTPPSAPVLNLCAGWLKADLGSGLVLSHPGSWGSQDGLSLYKPPVIRDRIDLASSPTGIRGEPLTGLGGQFNLLGSNISLLLCSSAKDAVGDGHHRTSSETAGRGEVKELLGGIRISISGLGLSVAAAQLREDSTTASWIRGGLDWDHTLADFRITGEVALGTDGDSLSAAFWGALCHETDLFRQTLTFVRTPSSFPGDRISVPAGPSEGSGLGYGFRWRLIPRLVLNAGASAYTTEEGGLFRGSALISIRLPWHMEAQAGVKAIFSEREEDSWRGWLSSSWQPLDRVKLSSRIQLTGCSEGDSLPHEQGFSLGTRLGWDISPVFSTGFSCTAFSTDGYASRIYSSDASLPGEFGSSALWGSGFRMSVRGSATLSRGLHLRLSAGHTWKEDVSSLGSGWEETEGGGRTELGLQVDYSLP